MQGMVAKFILYTMFPLLLECSLFIAIVTYFCQVAFFRSKTNWQFVHNKKFSTLHAFSLRDSRHFLIVQYLQQVLVYHILTSNSLDWVGAQNVDDGRLRMKPNCIVLSDVALRKKALDVLFSYTPAWLRLGLVVVLGPIALSNGKSLALDMAGCNGGDIDISFLEVLIEEHFFADSVLSKSYAANRSALVKQSRG